MNVIVSNIQRFCLHDGPGIRTTIFFKGCNLRCPWCSNPENIKFDIERYEDNKNCGYYGFKIELSDLEREIMKDKEYYKNCGGVTFSGGEPLLQFKKIEKLLINLKKEKINICVETALSVPKEFVDLAIKYVDEFYIDIKILDNKNIKKINGNIELYKENVKKILSAEKKATFRIPIVYDYTYTPQNIRLILEFIKENKIKEIEIFQIHRMGEKKYLTLNKKMPDFEKIKDIDLEKTCNVIKKYCYNTKIIKI